jgi:hypothetical protein
MWFAVNFANWNFVLNWGPEPTCPNHLERQTVICDITQYSLSTIVGLVRTGVGRFEFFSLMYYVNIIFIVLYQMPVTDIKGNNLGDFN